MNEMSKIVAEAELEIGKPAKSRWVLMLSVPLILLAGAAYFWLTSGKTVSTDNAQIGAPVVTVSSEVSGKIIGAYVQENQHVNPGDLLFRIDPAPFRIALLQAQAALGNARLNINEMAGMASSKGADAESKDAMISAAQSRVTLAHETYQRQADLMQRGFTTRAQLDAARSGLLSAQASVVQAAADKRSAQASAMAARAKLGANTQGLNPAVAAATALVEKAQLDLSRTEVRAPIAGIVTHADKLQLGNNVMQSLSEVTLVGDGGYWVEANFKETQLGKLRLGQPADIQIDAIPDKVFKARVSGIGAGTGSQFSMLPAQNANGNWVKVTQRVPVRLSFIDKPDQVLAAGWSAIVTVHIAH
jgi:membrane fusion protein (multidrug efflux system)